MRWSRSPLITFLAKLIDHVGNGQVAAAAVANPVEHLIDRWAGSHTLDPSEQRLAGGCGALP
jgi:hypothetical protein